MNGYVQSVAAALRSQPQTRYVVGIVGETGHGKSSFINKYCETDIQQTQSSATSCTALATRIVHSRPDKPHATADIRFHSKEQFIQNAEIAKNSIKSRQNTRQNTDDGDDDEEELNRKAAIEQTVAAAFRTTGVSEQDFLQISRAEYISRLPGEAQGSLGQTVNLNGNMDVDELYSMLEEYTVDEPGSGEWDFDTETVHLWPLVAEVIIYLDIPVLEQGVELIDLPGVNGTNAARAITYRQYMEKCDVLILANIVVRMAANVANQQLFKSMTVRHVTNDKCRLIMLGTKRDDFRPPARPTKSKGNIEAAKTKVESDKKTVNRLELVRETAQIKYRRYEANRHTYARRGKSTV